MSVLEFWGNAALITRVAFITAVVTALVHLGSYAGLTTIGAGAFLYAFHVVVMILGLVDFSGNYQTAYRQLHGPTKSKPEHRDLPRWLILAMIAAAFNVAVVAWLASSIGTGYPRPVDGGYAWFDGDLVRQVSEDEYRRYFATDLRIFSSAWLLFSLVISAMSYRRLPTPPVESPARAVTVTANRRPADVTSVERSAAIPPVPAVDTSVGSGFFFGLPAPVIAVLAVVVFIAPAVADGLSKEGRFLGHVVGAAAFLTLAIRATYLYDRRFFGRTMAMVFMCVFLAGVVATMLNQYSNVATVSWPRIASRGARVVMWAGLVSVPLFGGFIALRELRRVSRRW